MGEKKKKQRDRLLRNDERRYQNNVYGPGEEKREIMPAFLPYLQKKERRGS